MGLLLGLALAFTPAYAQNKLAIIIDDIGYNQALGVRAASLPGAFTLAVLPFTPHGQQIAELAHQHSKEIMLHAPMSNERQLALGKGGLVESMDRASFVRTLNEDLASVPYVKGVNNHMGSLLTQKAEPMAWLMDELKRRKLYFVDSRTTAKTQALFAAERAQLPSRKRDVFLDDERDSAKILAQLKLALAKARASGSAIAIGHPYPETLAVLEQLSSLLVEYQVELVSVSALLPHMPSYRQYCAAPPVWMWPQLNFPINPMEVPNFFANNR